jgi:stage II sporulation protein D
MSLARLVVILALLFSGCTSRHNRTASRGDDSLPGIPPPLEKILESAIGDSEGTILVMDPRSGTMRAVWNSRLAFEQSFPPGSAIKPFVLLAGLRSGIVGVDSRRECRGGYLTSELKIDCSHKRRSRPFDPVEALAYSCNDYFGQLGEKLSESAFLSTLNAFGFGQRTGVNAAREASGTVRGGEWNAGSVLGETPNLLVTPIQLLVAYSALFNGGLVFRPLIEHQSSDTSTHIKATLRIEEQDREMIEAGMRGAIRFGTASQAGFGTMEGRRVFGKTGTSGSSNGFRTQGWFVGFAGNGRTPSIGIVVLLKRATGRDAAAVAARALASIGEQGLDEPRERRLPDAASRTVKVQLTGDDHRIVELPLERYIAGVLSTEYSVENNIQALKAHAVASRSFAISNYGRHAREGFDFCSTTHCQRFSLEVPSEQQNRAVQETVHLTINDAAGMPVEALFHADCGGSTTNATALWGVAPRMYLKEVRDEYCENRSIEWTDRLKAKDLVRALGSDPLSSVGSVLKTIRVTDRDHSGRVQWIALEGERSKRIRGWDFKLIVGRTLGWNVIKSSQFDVRREGDEFIFNGRGHGHGLGMCQTGAGALARQGVSFERILAHYYPGTTIGQAMNERRSMASEGFSAYFTSSTRESDVKEALEILENARHDIGERLKRFGVQPASSQKVEITICGSTQSYRSSTGMPGWTAAVTREKRIVSQPLDLLRRRGVLVTALKHEYAHTVIEALGRGRTPRWLAEGLSVHFAGEGPQILDGAEQRLSPDELERRIGNASSAAELKVLYAQAYHEVRSMILREGEARIWQKIARGTEKPAS